MLRNIGAVLAGLLVGACANMALVMANMMAFPPPGALDMADPVAFAAYVAGLPARAFVVPVLAHLTQAALGGWLAARLAGSRPRELAMVVGVLTVMGSVQNMATIGGPAWMWAELPLELALAWGAGGLELRRRARAGDRGTAPG